MFPCPSLVVLLSAAPTPGPTEAYSPAQVDSFTPDVSRETVQDLIDPDGAARERHGEHPDDSELPRQIHIQQHLKLHFHPQGESRTGARSTF